MITWMIKKYIIGKVNGLVSEYRESIDLVAMTLTIWIGRLEKILSCLRATLAKLDDGRIDEVEMDQAVSDVEKVIKEW